MKRILLIAAVLIGVWYGLVLLLIYPGTHGRPTILYVTELRVKELAEASADEGKLQRMIEDCNRRGMVSQEKLLYTFHCEKTANGWIVTATPSVEWSYKGSWIARVLFLNFAKDYWYEYRVDTSVEPVFIFARRYGNTAKFERWHKDPIVIAQPAN